MKNTDKKYTRVTKNELDIIRKIPYDEAIELINDIREFRLDRLSKKERGFIEFVEKSWEDDEFTHLTPNMSKWLNKIYDRVMR